MPFALVVIAIVYGSVLILQFINNVGLKGSLFFFGLIIFGIIACNIVEKIEAKTKAQKKKQKDIKKITK